MAAPGGFDPDQYLEEKANAAPAARAPSGEEPVDPLQVQAFDPDAYLNDKGAEQSSLAQAKYGTIGQEALTGAEGFAKGLLGPVATAGEKYLSKQGIPGLSPEDQAGREAANPLIHGGTEAAGFLTGAGFGTGEAAVVGEAGEAAAKLAGLGGEGASAISRIASSGIKTGAEMSALQAGDEISKAINEDPSQSIGTAAANIGLAGILGGAGGVVLGSVSPFWQASMEKMGVPKLIDDAKAQYGFRRALPEGGDVTQAITNEVGTRMQEVDNVSRSFGEMKGASIARAMPEVTPEATSRIDGQMNDIASNVTHSIEKASDNAYLKGSVPKFAQDLQDFLEVATDPNASYADKFDAANDLKRALNSKARFSLTAEDTAAGKLAKSLAAEIRPMLEDARVWGDAGTVQKEANAAYSSFSAAQDDAIKKLATTSHIEGGYVADPNKIKTLVNQSLQGKAGLKTNFIRNYLESSQKLADKLNEIYTNAGLEAPVRLTPTPALDHTLGRSSPGTTLGNWLFDKGLATVAGHTAAEGVGAGLGELIGHPMLGAYFGDKVLSHVFTTIAKPLLESASHGRAFKSSLDFVVNVLKGDKLLSSGAENLFKAGAEIIPKQLIPNLATREKTEKALEYAANPENMGKVGGHLSHYMPNHAVAAAMTATRASQYFSALKPKVVQNSPLDEPSTPDPYAKAAYDRQLDIAAQPLLLLKHAKDGTLQPQDVQTVQTVYPHLVEKMASQAFEAMTKVVSEGKEIPYSKRMSLSLLLGQPLDSTLTSPVMQSIILANAPKNAQASQTMGGKHRAVSRSTASTQEKVNQSYATPLQAREAEHSQG